MMKIQLLLSTATLVAANENVNSVDGALNWDWDKTTSSYTSSGKDYGKPTHFDTNYFAALLGTKGHDDLIVHPKVNMPKVGMTPMEKVTAVTSISTRANIRKQLVGLLKQQVNIENMYTNKKEKLYMSASAVYGFINRLLHSACNIALSNDGLWKEQMQCFTAYKQLLEVYAMWNGVRDISFALENGMAVTEKSFDVCGKDVVTQDMWVAHDPSTQRLQNQYLVAGAMRKCYDNLQIKVEALRQWLSQLLVNSDNDSERSQSCLFKTITVLTCLSSTNQEQVLDLAIKQEHSMKVAYSFSKYASTAMKAIEGDNAGEVQNTEDSTLTKVPTDKRMMSIPQAGQGVALREVRPIKN